MREKQHGKDIRREEHLVEQKAAEVLERKREETKQTLEKEHDEQVKGIL